MLSKKYYVIVAAIILVLIGVGTGLLVRSRNTTVEPIISAPTTTSANLVYARNGEVWRHDQTSVQITHTDSTVYAYRYSLKNNNLAYIKGRKITNENGYSYVEPQSVHLKNLDSNVEKEIYSLQAITSEDNADFIIQIRDLGFSDDGQLLAITTSDSLFIFDITTQVLNNIFTVKPQFRGGGGGSLGVFSYHSPVFSPDRTKILLTLGFYEGSAQAIVDLTTSEITRLPYTSYISGTRVIGWQDNKSLLAIEYTNEDLTGESGSQIISVAWPTLEITQIKTPTNVATGLGILVDNNLYYTSKSRVESDKKFDNFVAFDGFDHIYKLNLSTKQETELGKFQTLEANEGLKAILKLDSIGQNVYIDFSEFDKQINKSVVSIYQLEPAPMQLIQKGAGTAIYN